MRKNKELINRLGKKRLSQREQLLGTMRIMGKIYLSRWTRKGILDYPWSPFESFEKLVMDEEVQKSLIKQVEIFQHGQKYFHSLRLPWRYGVFFFGPSGSGKTAAGRAIAKALNWSHLTIPAHEILDSHFLERAFADVLAKPNRVIVLEDVDLMVRVMEPEVFFTLLDHTMERAEGTFWVANSRHPELAPKTQLLRPGRFDQAIRMGPPGEELRRRLLAQLLEGIDEGIPEEAMNEWISLTSRLSFSHFEELRQVLVRLRLNQEPSDSVVSSIKNYLEDQVVAGDRWGGLSDQTLKLNERVNQVDPRILMAALEMTDVFRTLIEKVIADAAEQAADIDAEGN